MRLKVDFLGSLDPLSVTFTGVKKYKIIEGILKINLFYHERTVYFPMDVVLQITDTYEEKDYE